MILTDISNSGLKDMQRTLMMEGIFNRDAKLREVYIKMISFIDDLVDDMWFVREFTRFLGGQLMEASINDIAENMNCDRSQVEPDRISNHFSDRKNLLLEIREELEEALKNMGAP